MTISTPIDDTVAFEELLEQLRAMRAFDFTGYKRSSLVRRTLKRMGEVGAGTFEEYADRLRSDPNEPEALFNTILINVTSFFRDLTTWRVLERVVVPDLVARSMSAGSPPAQIRVWSAGCATGQEAFSIAMLFAEAIGIDDLSSRLKIYATDVDDDALAEGRLAIYTAKAVESVPEELRQRYLQRVGTRYAVIPAIRRTTVFGRHDLVRDAPISRVGLLLCRNTLMYLTRAAQQSVLDSFHFALRGGGYLCLGKSEMMVSHTRQFESMDLKRRIFTPVFLRPEEYRHWTMTGGSERRASSAPVSVTAGLKTRAFELNGIPQLVLDAERRVVLANGRARALFGLENGDLGKPIQDLRLSYAPVELRSLIDKAESDAQPVVTHSARWDREDGPTFWDITVASLSGSKGPVGTMIAFVDVTAHHGMEEEVQRLQLEVQSAYVELQSTVEELETTNEELQSTNEELETTNEELQSTNEELETMNEELQSTNEALETMNDELRMRSTELNQVNEFFESVLLSLNVGVAVTDANFAVQVWNRESENLWGLRSDEVRGQNLLGLDIGLPVDRLRVPGMAVLKGETAQQTLELEAITRLGRSVRCAVSIMPLPHSGPPRGLIILTSVPGATATR